MSLTPAQLAKIRQKEASLSAALHRDPLVNYREGWFFVTLNTRDEVPVLSYCAGSPSLPDGHPDAPHCVYTAVGQGVLAAWERMAAVCDTVKLDLYEAMPEHFHGLLHLLPGNRRHLGSLISGFMSGSSHAYWDTLGIDWCRNRNEKVEAKTRGGKHAYALLPADRDRDHSRSLIGPALFVHGYNDVEPITEEEVEVKRAYIRDQARKRLIQGDRHDCFAKHRGQHSRSWTVERALQALAADRFLVRDAARCAAAQETLRGRLAADERGLTLDYLGDRSLMAAPRKLPLVCHRADVARFEEQKAAVLAAARDGAVIVSAFISPKERDIRDQLITELLPVIEITDNGFSDRYKPSGKAFYAVAENRLVQLSPWRYLYQKDVSVSREMCLVMNELARTVAAQPDDWWKSR